MDWRTGGVEILWGPQESGWFGCGFLVDGDDLAGWFFILGTCDGDMGLEKGPNRIEFESSSVKNLNENILNRIFA